MTPEAQALRAEARALREENARLRKINASLIGRAERSTEFSGGAYSIFQTAIALESQVRARTLDLQATLADLAEAKEEAERARANLQGAVESLREGFALFDSEDRLVMCNRWFRVMAPEIAHQIAAGLSFAAYAALLARSGRLVFNRGVTPEDWVGQALSRHERNHASYIQELRGDRWIQVSEQRTPGGGLAVIQTDITDMVRWERLERDKRLDEQARLVRATLDQLNQGVCVFDSSDRLAAWNDRYRELLDLPFDLLKRGASFLRVIGYIGDHGLISSRKPAFELMQWVRSRGSSPPLTVELTHRAGRALIAECRQSPDGGFVISFTDVTAERASAHELALANETLEQRVAERTAELSQLNAALRREIEERALLAQEILKAKEAAELANLSKTRFLAAASHDLLQPLNAARLFIASLSEARLPPAQEGLVRRLDSALRSVEHLLGALLDISKLDARAVEAEPRPMSIAAILTPLENEFRALALARGLKLKVRPSAAMVMSDPGQLRRIVQNLVSNAIRYTKRGGVVIGCRRRGGQLRIEVWDSGVGVAPEHLKTIFEEFRRIEDPAAAGERGAGLGLAIVERAARLLGHPLEVRSKPGEGSVFSVSAPLVEAPLAAPPLVESSEGAEPEGREDGLIALVVENDAQIRHALTALLAGWSMDVLAVGSTAEALEALQDLGMAPDVILADYHLDGEDTGLKAVAALRAAAGVEIPAILATADRSPGVIAEAARMGVRHLPKPTPPARLRALLRRVGAAAGEPPEVGAAPPPEPTPAPSPPAKKPKGSRAKGGAATASA
ncbi:hybrid sensor histidine kinase/response regulator [Neomegalonema perideroedes]|uniref:hybrid sensor histidine kinase/response regulator n=1 Tax=Neomegalonema perideroedes TaxID=217219 RepID=UPI00037B8327|nr:NahK/ErcS family hybrid sensor histidine kinase/response regulator [Neomegalonema perideroedes]